MSATKKIKIFNLGEFKGLKGDTGPQGPKGQNGAATYIFRTNETIESDTTWVLRDAVLEHTPGDPAAMINYIIDNGGLAYLLDASLKLFQLDLHTLENGQYAMTYIGSLKGVKGVDYWTEEDKAEIIAEIGEVSAVGIVSATVTELT